MRRPGTNEFNSGREPRPPSRQQMGRAALKRRAGCKLLLWLWLGLRRFADARGRCDLLRHAVRLSHTPRFLNDGKEPVDARPGVSDSSDLPPFVTPSRYSRGQCVICLPTVMLMSERACCRRDAKGPVTVETRMSTPYRNLGTQGVRLSDDDSDRVLIRADQGICTSALGPDEFEGLRLDPIPFEPGSDVVARDCSPRPVVLRSRRLRLPTRPCGMSL